jgi:hypothetical protein
MTPQIPDQFIDAAPLLVPRPVGLTPLAIRRLALALQGAESAVDAVSPVAADYGIGLYLDLPESNVPVTAGLLRTWDATLDGAINVSLLNAQRALSNVARDDEDGAVHLSSEFLGAAILLSSDTVAGLIDGRMLAVIPTATDVLVAPADDPSAIAAVARRADALIAAADRTVSVTPLTASPGEPWTPTSWPESAAKTAGLLHRRWLGIQYAQQRDPLRETFERRGDDPAVSSMQVAQRPDGWTISRSNLTTAVPTLLPWADEAVLVDDNGRIVVVPMTELAAIPGVLVREPDIDPPIMRALRFPSELFS